MLRILMVPVIMACAIIGTIAILFFICSLQWSIIYLIRSHLLKCEDQNLLFKISKMKDIIAIVIAVITLIMVALLLIYGVPFVAGHFSELPLLPAS